MRPRTRRLVGDCPSYDVMEAARLFEDEEWDTDAYSTRKENRLCWMAARCIDKGAYLVEFEWFGGRGTPRRQVLRAVAAYPHFGGVRWWWECPGKPVDRWDIAEHHELCGRRTRLLYLRQGRWACRVCHRLTYLSAWGREKKTKRRGTRFDESMSESVARAREWLERRKKGEG